MHTTTVLKRFSFIAISTTISLMIVNASAQTIIEYSGSPARVTGNMNSDIANPYAANSPDKNVPTFISTNGKNCVAIRGKEQVALDLTPPCTVVKRDNKNHKSVFQNRILFYVLGQQPNNAALVTLTDANDAFTTLCEGGEIAGNRIQSVFLEPDNNISLDNAIDFEPICASMALQLISR